MSLDSLRNQVLSNLVAEEKVEVNQRHLIDKILARYSAEFVVFRELMQNADDAKSSSVEIIFQTQKNGVANAKTNFKDKCVRILFKNNGFPFRPEDWNRLKKIAEGNPDEQKIGAFGVGFYSLFSVCEEPFVSSGGQGMAFYWRGDQLFAKRGPTDQVDQTWTTFLMDAREPAELPNPDQFGRFIATSLGFTGNLREVTVYYDDHRIVHLTKKMTDPRAMNIISGIGTYSPKHLFQLTSVDVRNVQLDVQRLIIPQPSLRSRTISIQDCSLESTTIFLRIANGYLDVRVSKEFSAEMERSTKKKPPSKTLIQMLFTGFDEHSSSGGGGSDNAQSKKVIDIFKDLLPYPEQGRIFIGFPTHQTTGCCSHLAARVIPTVERESVDLVDKTLAVYNEEMLTMAGILSRLLYEDEMSQIALMYRELIGSHSHSDNDVIKASKEWLQNRAAHALTHFTFKYSTPNPRVGNIIENIFFQCSSKNLSILSTTGVMPINEVRLPNQDMQTFIKYVPVVPTVLSEKCGPFFRKAKEQLNYIQELTINDVFTELRHRKLSYDEIVALFKWWIGHCNKNGLNVDQMNQLLRLATVQVPGSNHVALEKFRYFLNPKTIPPDCDVPNNMLPYSITKSFHKNDLEKFFG
ncbi:9435_t:CDS:2, partial [Ambispora leptoticha]